jgi:Fur family ferric uptake transcriptional regulator
MSKRHDSLSERLRDAGLRLTNQRRIVIHLLENANRHLDAEEVYRLARRKDPKIHRATVYRTLGTLKKLGFVDELDLMHVSGDRHYYEVRPSTFHIHLICTLCGSVQEPGGSWWQEMRSRVHDETGFEPESIRLEMSGLCRACRGSGIPAGSLPNR